jgi:hypothetical protein
MNQYLESQVARLLKYSKERNGRMFWFVGICLMVSYEVYMVSSLNHLSPQWHRKMNQGKVFSLIRDTRKLMLRVLEE